MQSNNARYMENIGAMLINNVSFKIGGDEKPYWYCLKCGQRKTPDQREHPKTFCGAKTYDFNYRLFKEAWQDCFDEYMTEDKFKELDPDDIKYQHILENYNVDTESICNGREYVKEKREGLTIDSQNGEYLNLWKKLSNK